MKTLYSLFIGLFLFSIIGNAQFSGTITVGSGSGNDYQCLTCDSGLFKALSDSGLSGNVNVQIMSDLSNEGGIHALSEITSGHSIIIQPGNAGMKTISLRPDSHNVLIDLDSVTNVTIDGRFGGAGRNLTFKSQDTSFPVFQVVRDCKNVTIRNCVIQSNNDTTLGILGGAINLRSFGTFGSDSVTISHNLFEAASPSASLGVGIQATAVDNNGQVTAGLSILYNDFNSINQMGIVLESSSGMFGPANIRGNSFFSTGNIEGPNDATPLSAIYLNSGSGHQIIGNFIGGKAPKCAGGEMSMVLADFSDQVYLFRIGSGVSGSKPIVFDSNIVNNITIFGSQQGDCQAHVFHVHTQEKVDIHFGTQFGNHVGDTQVDASTPGGANIWFQERFNSTANAFRVFNLLGDANYSIRNSSFGGILNSENSNKGSELKIINVENAASIRVDSNQFGGVKNNIVQKAAGLFEVLSSTAGGEIRGNEVGGLTGSTDFADHMLVFNLFLTGGDAVIEGNKIGNLSDNASSSGSITRSNAGLVPRALRTINVSGQRADRVRINDNTIGSIHIETNDKLKKVDFNGIYVGVVVANEYEILRNQIGSGVTNNIYQAADGKVWPITVREPGNRNVRISENVIRGITTTNHYANSFSAIDITGKSNQSNKIWVTKNIIGDTTVDAGSSPSIQLVAGGVGKAPESYGITSVARVDALHISENIFGGIKASSSGQELDFIPILIGDVKDSLEILRNQIGSHSTEDNMYFSAFEKFAFLMYISTPDGNDYVEIAENLISNCTYTGNFNSFFTAIRTTNGTAIGSMNILNNTIQNLKIGNGGNLIETKMIHSSNNNSYINGNSIRGIWINSNFPGVQFEGINIDENLSTHELIQNKVWDIHLLDNAIIEGSATGLSIFGPGSEFLILKNLVKDFHMDSRSIKSSFKGILVNTCQKATVANNIVLYNNKQGTISPSGIFDFANTGTIEIFHNTVDLRGVLPSTADIFSSCYVKNNDATRRISNNLFSNRTTGGERPHYALYFGSSTGNIGCDFNLIYSENTQTTPVFYTQNLDLSGWQDKGFGLKSVAPVPQNIVDSLTGKQLTQLGNDNGLSNLGVSEDYEGNSRPLDNGFDMGAFELPTSGLDTGKKPIPPPAGIAEFSGTPCKVFPNPANDKITIDGITEGVVTISDPQGRIIKNVSLSEGFQIQVADLNPGIYFIRLNEDLRSVPLHIVR